MGKDPDYKREAEKLGKEMASNSITLVYGGGNRGLMGVLAHSVHNNGGKAPCGGKISNIIIKIV